MLAWPLSVRAEFPESVNLGQALWPVMPVMQMPDWSAKPDHKDNFRLKCVGQREPCWPRKGNSSGGGKKETWRLSRSYSEWRVLRAECPQRSALGQVLAFPNDLHRGANTQNLCLAPSSFWAHPAFWGHLCLLCTRPFSFNPHKKPTKKAKGNWGPSHSQLRCGRARTPAPIWAQPVLLVPAHVTSSLHVQAEILPVQGVSSSPNTTHIFTTWFLPFPFSPSEMLILTPVL